MLKIRLSIRFHSPTKFFFPSPLSVLELVRNEKMRNICCLPNTAVNMKQPRPKCDRERSRVGHLFTHLDQ